MSSSQVEKHYDERTLERIGEKREESRIIGLRRYQNDLKLKLISYASLRVFMQDRSVLDLACGRGGDLGKWKKKVKKYIGIDISSLSIDEARKRNMERKYFKEDPEVFDLRVCDVCRPAVGIGGGSVGIVSCMFAIQYMLRSKESINDFLRNIFEVYKPQVFIAIFPSKEKILKFKNKNKFCKISNIDLEEKSYSFSLDNCVENCKEWFVEEDIFDKAFKDNGYIDYSNVISKPLTYKYLSKDEKHIADLYRFVVFAKKITIKIKKPIENI